MNRARLHAENRACGVSGRLVVNLELPTLDGPSQVPLQLQELEDPGGHRLVEDFVSRLALGLGAVHRRVGIDVTSAAVLGLQQAAKQSLRWRNYLLRVPELSRRTKVLSQQSANFRRNRAISVKELWSTYLDLNLLVVTLHLRDEQDETQDEHEGDGNEDQTLEGGLKVGQFVDHQPQQAGRLAGVVAVAFVAA